MDHHPFIGWIDTVKKVIMKARGLNYAQNELLLLINDLYENNPYPPIPSDLIGEGDNYSRVINRVYRLEQENWVEIHRKGRTIRAIIPLAKP